MTRTLTALAAAAAMTAAVVAIPQQAEARFRGGPFIGGLAAGAIIGGALAAPYYYGGYGGPYGYYGGGPYYGSYAGYYGDCWRERVATPYGWRWQRVCR
jgi:hypothetical protein